MRVDRLVEQVAVVRDRDDRPGELRDDRSSRPRRSASRWVSGSSSSSRSGWRIRHAASATSLRCPPDSRPSSAARGRPRRGRARRACARASPREAGAAGRTQRSSSPCWRVSTRSMRARSATTSGRAELRFHGAQLGVERRHVGARGQTVCLGGAVVAVGVLLEVGDHEILAAHDLAGRRRLAARQDAQQRRLARAVRAHDADARPVGHLEVGSLQARARSRTTSRRARG